MARHTRLSRIGVAACLFWIGSVKRAPAEILQEVAEPARLPFSSLEPSRPPNSFSERYHEPLATYGTFVLLVLALRRYILALLSSRGGA